MDHSIRHLDIHTIKDLAKDAVERCIPLNEANHYDGHIGEAFRCAYEAYAEALTTA